MNEIETSIINQEFVQQAREKAADENISLSVALRELLFEMGVADDQIERELAAFIACNMA